MTRRSVLAKAALAGLLVPARGFAWQDLSPDYVRAQVERIADPKTPAADRRAATWALASAGRASVGGLAAVARTEPRLLWTAIGLLDLVRTDALVVELFSQLLDKLPGELADTGEIRGFLGSRLADMLGRTFKTDAERRAFVADNARYLAFEPLTLRFQLDEEARKKRQPMLHYPYAPSAHADVDLAFFRLLLALHLQQSAVIEALCPPGPELRLVHGGGRLATRPELDLDAFSDAPSGHRALSVRDEGKGHWLVRTGDAYFFFAGTPPRCVKAGMKPIE
ncbi:MAG: hypothetical protein U1A78_17145 [Polyangia bacterium]